MASKPTKGLSREAQRVIRNLRRKFRRSIKGEDIDLAPRDAMDTAQFERDGSSAAFLGVMGRCLESMKNIEHTPLKDTQSID